MTTTDQIGNGVFFGVGYSFLFGLVYAYYVLIRDYVRDHKVEFARIKVSGIALAFGLLAYGGKGTYCGVGDGLYSGEDFCEEDIGGSPKSGTENGATVFAALLIIGLVAANQGLKQRELEKLWKRARIGEGGTKKVPEKSAIEKPMRTTSTDQAEIESSPPSESEGYLIDCQLCSMRNYFEMGDYKKPNGTLICGNCKQIISSTSVEAKLYAKAENKYMDRYLKGINYHP